MITCMRPALRHEPQDLAGGGGGGASRRENSLLPPQTLDTGLILAPSVGSRGSDMNGSTGRPDHALQQLPNEAAQLILERLNFRDLKALSLSCKSFAAWSKMATR